MHQHWSYCSLALSHWYAVVHYNTCIRKSGTYNHATKSMPWRMVIWQVSLTLVMLSYCIVYLNILRRYSEKVNHFIKNPVAWWPICQYHDHAVLWDFSLAIKKHHITSIMVADALLMHGARSSWYWPNMWGIIFPSLRNSLTHWGLVTPYGDRDLGQHWLR